MEKNFTRLPLATWENIFRNIAEAQAEQLQEEGIEELIEQGVVERVEIEVVWLEGDGTNGEEWVLCSDCELFEDGFATEEAAQARLHYLERELL